jgi:hypothetical protein
MVATIQFIESTVTAFEQATEANLNTPGREGNMVVITDEMADEVMVTADLHGHRRNFNLIKKIADLDQHPRRHLILHEVCHGGPTYPTNGGCMSHAMLEDVAKLKVRYPDRVHFMLSNHEMAELMDYPILKAKKMLNLMFRLGMQEMYGPATEKVRAAMMPFIRSCPLAVRLPGGVFVSHTLPESVDTRGFDTSLLSRPLGPAELKENSPLFQFLWGRDFRQANAEAFAKAVEAKVLIHGHEPCDAGFHAPNDVQIILDCCNEKGTYLLIPTKPAWTHAELLKRVEPLAA